MAADMQSLSVGDPKEQITVPMIHTHESTRLRDAFIPFSKGRGKVTQTVVARRMTREYVLHFPFLLPSFSLSLLFPPFRFLIVNL